MPIYEYRCENGHTFEVLQSMSDDPVTECETCDAPVQRVLHSPAVHFKGSGFYTTDYGSREAPEGRRGVGLGSEVRQPRSSDSKSKGDSGSSGGSSSGSGDKAKASSGSKD